LTRTVVVYPAVEPTDEFLDILPMITGEFESFVRGRGYDLYRIREYMPEDSARHVDWKATAKSGSLKVARIQPRGRAQTPPGVRQLCARILGCRGVRKSSSLGRFARLAFRQRKR